MSELAVADWRSGMPARLAGAAVVGALTGGAGLLAGNLMPVARVPVSCRPAGGAGCGLFQPLASLLLGALLWLAVVIVLTLAAGAVFGWLAGRLVGVRLGVVVPLVWPVLLWVIAIVLRQFGIAMFLRGWSVVGYVALAFVLSAVLTAPQVWRLLFRR